MTYTIYGNKDPVPFDFEKYCSGNYVVITRCGKQVRYICHYFRRGEFLLVGLIEGDPSASLWDHEGIGNEGEPHLQLLKINN